MDDDTQEMYDVLAVELMASGTPPPLITFEYDCIVIYPQSGGMLALKRDGTWEGDIAVDPD